jgi:hypothetical protein
MDWDIQRRSVLWRYGDSGFPAGIGYLNGSPAIVADLTVPPSLVYRHMWAFAFAIPDEDSYAQYDASIIVTNGDADRRFLSWTTRTNQGVLDIPGQTYNTDNESHISFMPPFSAWQDGFSDPDKSGLITSGQDARMFAFQTETKQSVQSNRPVYRCIAQRIDLTTSCRRIRMEISNFYPQNAAAPSSGQTGLSATGWFAAGLQVKSQLRPY